MDRQTRAKKQKKKATKTKHLQQDKSWCNNWWRSKRGKNRVSRSFESPSTNTNTLSALRHIEKPQPASLSQEQVHYQGRERDGMQHFSIFGSLPNTVAIPSPMKKKIKKKNRQTLLETQFPFLSRASSWKPFGGWGKGDRQKDTPSFCSISCVEDERWVMPNRYYEYGSWEKRNIFIPGIPLFLLRFCVSA